MVGWWGGVCTVIFASTPSPTDLDWTVRLDWSLTISKRVFKKPDFATKKVGSSVIRFGV